MKNNSFLWAGLLVLSACTPQSAHQSSSLSDITSFKMNGTTALFRASGDSSSTGLSKASTGKMDRLYNLLDSGEYTRQIWVNDQGIEHELELSISQVKWLSKKYALVVIQDAFIGLVNIQNGSIIRLEEMDINTRSVTLFNGHLFAFSSDLKNLKRMNLETKQLQTHITLPANYTFIPGDRFLTSQSTLWWNDEGDVPDEGGSREPMLIDENYNVAAQVVRTLDNGDENYPTIAMTPNGDMTQVQITPYGGPQEFSYIHHNGKLFSVRSNSGPYHHLQASSPAITDVDFTLSEVNIHPTGVVHTPVEQIKPFTSNMNYDTGTLLCRGQYTIDSEKRHIVTGRGVLTVDLSAPVTQRFRYQENTQPAWSIFINSSVIKPSIACFISGDFIFFLGADNKLQRIDLTDFANATAEVLVNQTGIKSFYVVGKHVFFTTNEGTFRIQKDGSGLKQMPGDFNVNDVITVN
ncbi:hypothetical protein [Bdellovibrio bacteriovorus]|uniref:Uncharacterized protein n=1 Tax=Bdellovibrio bacteriovorus str. Tiberius TaxID=1069642 RepID=K7ZAD7_BDEBC|nr:hypothetical protein [Bdellovibrio bacteriovorus]AFY01629.1 Hypothetical protein Bdt_1942 [Bdellovibrio bacteriovorus str. Tiberius]